MSPVEATPHAAAMKRVRVMAGAKATDRLGRELAALPHEPLLADVKRPTEGGLVTALLSDGTDRVYRDGTWWPA